MKGVLIIAHGSRIKEANDNLAQMITLVKESLRESIIETACMEFSKNTIEEGIASLVDKGISEIKVIPFFLSMGVHLQQDIPRILEECALLYPGINIKVTEPIGTDKRIGEILIDRIRD